MVEQVDCLDFSRAINSAMLCAWRMSSVWIRYCTHINSRKSEIDIQNSTEMLRARLLIIITISHQEHFRFTESKIAIETEREKKTQNNCMPLFLIHWTNSDNRINSAHVRHIFYMPQRLKRNVESYTMRTIDFHAYVIVYRNELLLYIFVYSFVCLFIRCVCVSISIEIVGAR